MLEQPLTVKEAIKHTGLSQREIQPLFVPLLTKGLHLFLCLSVIEFFLNVNVNLSVRLFSLKALTTMG